jgi:hypothetical protein
MSTVFRPAWVLEQLAKKRASIYAMLPLPAPKTMTDPRRTRLMM